MVLAVMLGPANAMKVSMVTVAQVNMIIFYWCSNLVACQISWFCWPKHVWITVETNSTKIKKIYHKNKIYLLFFFHFFTCCIWQQSNIFDVSFTSKTNWIGIVYKLLRLVQTWTTTPFCIIIFILSMIFILLIILLVLCNTSTKCSNHGTCGDDGNCVCDNGYYGPNCSSKLKFLILGCTQLQAAL